MIRVLLIFFVVVFHFQTSWATDVAIDGEVKPFKRTISVTEADVAKLGFWNIADNPNILQAFIAYDKSFLNSGEVLAEPVLARPRNIELFKKFITVKCTDKNNDEIIPVSLPASLMFYIQNETESGVNFGAAKLIVSIDYKRLKNNCREVNGDQQELLNILGKAVREDIAQKPWYMEFKILKIVENN